MTTENRAKRVVGRIVRGLFYTVTVILIIAVVVHFSWKYSGSGQ